MVEVERNWRPKPKGKRPRLTIRAVSLALQKTRGNKTAAAEMLGVSWTAVQSYCRKYPGLAIAVRDAVEGLVDKAEDNIRQAVERGDLKVSRFVLQTIGRRRGWVFRQEQVVSGDPDQPIQIREVVVHIPVTAKEGAAHEVVEGDMLDEGESLDDADEKEELE